MDLSEKDMVIRLPNIKFSKGVCQGCILGKHPKNKYKRASHERTFKLLELIHSDISGPFPHMLMSQVKYVVTFIDYVSRYCWVYFLKHNSKVFDLFKVFRALVENQFGRKLKNRWRVCQVWVHPVLKIWKYPYVALYSLHTTTKWCCWEKE